MADDRVEFGRRGLSNKPRTHSKERQAEIDRNKASVAKDYATHEGQIHVGPNGQGHEGYDAQLNTVKKFGGKMNLTGYKKGGKVKKTGPALVHKDEVVLNKAQQKKIGPAKVKAAIKKEPTVADYRRTQK